LAQNAISIMLWFGAREGPNMRVSFFEHRPVIRIPVFLLLAFLVGVAVPALAQELTPEMLEEASRRTGLSKEEILRRYQAQQGGAAEAAGKPAGSEPGRTNLEGLDDSTGGGRFKDTDQAVRLPYDLALEREMEQALADAMTETVPGDTVGFFGGDFFRLDDGVFTPPSFGPVPADYLLGVGDEVIVNVWGGIEFQEVRLVDRDGSVILPDGGKIMCAGRTLEQVGQAVRQALARSHSTIDTGQGGDTQVEVTLGQLRAIRVYVVGAVNRPGSYEVSSVSRVLTALYAAGGPTIDGSLRNIQLVRGSDAIATIDLYEYLLKGKRTSDAQLREGDTVLVPDVGPAVRVHGEVKRPMYYEMKPGESLSDLLGYCGGFTARAATEVVHIKRILPPAERQAGQPDHVFLDVRYDARTMRAPGGEMALLDGDIITVDAIEDRLDNYVRIAGNVKRPGQYELRPGLTVSQLVAMAGGLWPDALLENAVIDRVSPEGDLSSFSIPLGQVLAGEAADVALQGRDHLHVFSRWEIQERPQVYISGEVYNPYHEDWREGMTLRDLILKAGGLKQNADWLRAEVARLRVDAVTSRDLATRPTQTVDVIQVELGADFLSSTESMVLEPWDRVSIRSLPWWENQHTVQVRGEVFYPGTFSLERKDERLSSVIRRAGGIKPDAYLVGARVIREQDAVGNIAIDLALALAQPGGEHDIILQQGDQVIVPDRMFTVKVVGEVGFPTSLVYEEGKKINDYVNMAGGYLEKADKGKTRVVWPNGMSLPNKGGSKVVAGSTIVVPQEPPPEGRDTWTTIRDISSIVASLATVWLIVDK
jgi:protein involved in polysaccharide export with SLBB domain